jgi:predicted ester cyclase
MKRSVIVVLVILATAFAIACRAKTADTKLEEQNKAIVKSYFALADAGDFEALGRLYEPTTVFYSPSGSVRPVSGAEDIEIGKVYAKAIPDLSHRIEELLASGDKVVARLVTKGTLKEEVPGFPPPGKPFEVSSIYIFTLKNGKIIEGRGEVDMLGLMIQLGMELKPRAEK